MTDIRL